MSEKKEVSIRVTISTDEVCCIRYEDDGHDCRIGLAPIFAKALGITRGDTGTLTWKPDVKSVRAYRRPHGSCPYLCGACGWSCTFPAFICGLCGTLNSGDPLPWPEPTWNTGPE